MYPIYPEQVLDATTYEPNQALVGQQVQVVTRNTTTPYPIFTAAGDPIPDSLVTVTAAVSTPTFYIDTDTPETVYLDWYDAGSGQRGPIDFEEVVRQTMLDARDAMEALAQGVVRSVNGLTPDENGDVTVEGAGGGVDDDGLAELIETPASATAQALTALYGPGSLFLDLDDPIPPGTPDGTLVFRNAGGGGAGPVAPVVYMVDDFERTVAAGSIGDPSGGGSYAALDVASDWSVSGGAARWIAPAAGTRTGYFRSDDYSQANVEIVGAVSQQSGGAGNRYWFIAPRRVAAAATQYGANIVLRGATASRPLQVDLGLQKGANEGDLSALTAGVLTTGAFGQRVLFKVRITQVDASTTRVQARIWLEGQTEPTTWQKDATDTTSAQQGAGSLHIGIRQNNAETLGSEARLHEYEVRSVVDG